MISSVMDELGQGLRSTFRRPGFSILAVLTLAVGIGFNFVAFTLIDRLLLQPLPYGQPKQLYAVGLREDNGWVGITPREFQAVENLALESGIGVARELPLEVVVQGGERVTSASAIKAGPGFFETLGVRFDQGRNFDRSEMSLDGRASQVILSFRFWQQNFDAESEVVGTTIIADGMPVSVVGVLPGSFHLVYPFDMVLPLAIDAEQPADGRNYIAVLRADSTAVTGGLGALIRDTLRSVYIGTSQADAFALADFGTEPLANVLAGSLSDLLTFFMLAALCVLLLASVNFANLMILRMLATRDAQAVREALGASRARMTIPLVAESLPIGILGVALGIGVALLASEAWVLIVPEELRDLLTGLRASWRTWF